MSDGRTQRANTLSPVEATFVIPARNEQANIRRCLDSIHKLKGGLQGIEIVVVDNGSTDETVPIAKELADIVEVHSGPNVGWLRNRGAALASGRLLAFVDADCELAGDWLEQCKLVLNALPPTSAVGNYYEIPTSASWIQRAWYSTKKGLNGPVSFLPAGNFAIPREVFVRLGGFNAGLRSGEDYDLFLRLRKLGGQVVAVPEIRSMHHEKISTLFGMMRREYWYGQGMFETGRHGVVSRPLVLSLLHASLLVAAAYTLIVQHRLVMAIALTLLLPGLMAVAACARAKRFSHFIQLVPIFLAYLLGRLGAVFWYLHKEITGRIHTPG